MVSLEQDPIKRAKHKTYGEIMKFGRGEMAKKLKGRLAGEPGRVAHAVDGRENDVDVADAQSDKVQGDLDTAMHGKHGGPQMKDGLAEHVGLGEMEDPLSMQDLHKGLAGPKASPEDAPEHMGSDQLAKAGQSKSHSGLLADLQDHEIKALLSKHRK